MKTNYRLHIKYPEHHENLINHVQTKMGFVWN